jgi:hypothetical protein
LAEVKVKSTLALFANKVSNCCAEVNTGIDELILYKPVVLDTATFADAIWICP